MYLHGRLVTEITKPRQQSLLAYLVLNSTAPVTRRYVSYVFWPGSTESQASTNLRYLLHQLRSDFPPIEELVDIGKRTLHWNPSTHLEVDVHEFEALASGGLTTPEGREAEEALRRGVAFYRGDLLPSCYDDWIFPHRERLGLLYRDALQRLIDILDEAGRTREAISYATTLFMYDKTNETACRRLMGLHAANGDRASALRAYHICASTLEQELSSQPGVETYSLYERTVAGAPPAATAPQARTVPRSVRGRKVSFVGRGEELALLLEAWEATEPGSPQLAVIHGETGVGKSRLAEEFLSWAEDLSIATARSRCYDAQGGLAYAPFTELLGSEIYASRLDGVDEAALAEAARLAPELLAGRGLSPPPPPANRKWRRRRLFEAVGRMLVLNPETVLLIDDIQWCDRDSLALLHYLLHLQCAAKLLVVATMRSEDTAPADHPLTKLLDTLRVEGKLWEVDLKPLDKDETLHLASQLARRELNREEIDAVYSRTDGNPLYIVELLRANRDEEDGSVGLLSATGAAHAIPSTIEAVIHSRLSRLSRHARRLVGLAAVIGRSFTYDVLLGASDMDEDLIVRSLDELWQRRIIREQGEKGYDFAHDWFRDVAYAELGSARRRLYHKKVAEALEAAHADVASYSLAARLATHFDRAGMKHKAYTYHRLAGAAAQRVYANSEAAHHLRRTLELMDSLPEAAGEESETELSLLTSLGVSLVALEGYASPEVRRTYSRAYEITRNKGDYAVGPILRAMAISAVSRLELEKAYEYGRELLRFADSRRDAALATEAYYVTGITSFWKGEFKDSTKDLKLSISVYQPSNRNLHIALFSQDPLVVCRCRLAFSLWCLGRVDEAVSASGRAVEEARRGRHPFSLGYVLFWTALLHTHMGHITSALESSQELVRLSRKHELGLWECMGRTVLGWATAHRGDVEGGVEQMRAGIGDLKSTGSEFLVSCFEGLLAELEAGTGEIEGALRRISGAIRFVRQEGERWCLSPLLRRRGDLLWRWRRDEKAAVESYREAVEVARAQGAKSFEQEAEEQLDRLMRRARSRAGNAAGGRSRNTLGGTSGTKGPQDA